MGDREAVIDGEKRWSWRELDVVIAGVAGMLAALGLRKGDRIAILRANSAEFIAASHAASRLGAIVVPINTRLAPPEVAHILSDSGSIMLALGSEESPLATSCAALCPDVLFVSLGRSANHKIPRVIIFGPVPRNSTGKLQKQLLREAADPVDRNRIELQT